MATHAVGKGKRNVKRDISFDGKPVMDYTSGTHGSALADDDFVEIYLIEPGVAVTDIQIKASQKDGTTALTNALDIGIGNKYDGDSTAFETGARKTTAVTAANLLTGITVDLSYFGDTDHKSVIVQTTGAEANGIKFQAMVNTGRPSQ